MTQAGNDKNRLTSLEVSRLRQAINTQISLVDLAREMGFTCRKHGSRTLRLEEHDSCILWPEKNIFRRYSRVDASGKTIGGGPIDFYMHFGNRNFYTALQELGKQVQLDVIQSKAPVPSSVPLSSRARHAWLVRELHFMQPANKEKGMKQVYAYLIKTRCIDPEVVSLFVRQKALFAAADAQGHIQCAFVGHNEEGLLCAVCYRSASAQSRYMGDVSCCNYRRGWFMDPQFSLETCLYEPKARPSRHKILLCFESSIEMMSYMSLLKNAGHDWKKYAYLSCGSVSKTESVLETCRTYGYKKVLILFNNDLGRQQETGINPGAQAAACLQKHLEGQGIQTAVLLPEETNDWNELLCRNWRPETVQTPAQNPEKICGRKNRGLQPAH